jgi:amicyanin
MHTFTMLRFGRLLLAGAAFTLICGGGAGAEPAGAALPADAQAHAMAHAHEGHMIDRTGGGAPTDPVQNIGAPTGAGDPPVSIKDFAFGPQVVTIGVGDSVTWTNDDGAPHTVTFKDGSAGSKSIFPNQTFARTFDKPGTYEYFCSFHPFMTGRVVVVAK